MAGSPANSVAEHLLQRRYSNAQLGREQNRIQQQILANGETLDGPNFTRLSSRVLPELFRHYDERFFLGQTLRLVHQRRGSLDFRLSRRMTKTGGKTTRIDFHQPSAQGQLRSYEITISSHLLFQAFRSEQGSETVSGVKCQNRLDALQRIFEHEMIHLLEMLLWEDSSCAAPRFKGIARRFFGHTQSTHQLPTRTEVAKQRFGIAPGQRVAFQHEGQSLRGFVNRIGQRATVLVEHPGGEQYSDGRRYRKYYVPLALLTRLTQRSQR